MCSPSLGTWEMQIKPTMRRHLAPVRMTMIRKTSILGGDVIGAATEQNRLELNPTIKGRTTL